MVLLFTERKHSGIQRPMEVDERMTRPRTKTKRRRHQRSVSVEQHIEVMVVADNLMAQHYGNDLQLYILTLMSIVSTLICSQKSCSFMSNYTNYGNDEQMSFSPYMLF